MQTRVLVVSASMGAGHDGAGRELVRRLKAEGYEAEMRDYLDSAPLRIGVLLKSSYQFQMKYLAWSYDLTYRLLYRVPGLCPPIGRVMTRLTGPQLLRWAEDFRADVIVSTYPLTSVVLGELRKGGRLAAPCLNFITDFGVHPFWTHPGIDLNMAVHSRSAVAAERRSGRPSIATGPMVSPRFAEANDRAATRAELGLSPQERAILIVSGSWGVGDVASTFRTLTANGRFVPIVVCGRDERLRRRLSRISGGRVLGWTDDMPALMAATDALVENAGGLTAMEAFSVGLPVISFRPIAGHGKENTAEMQAAGVSRVARTPRQLVSFLDEVTAAGPARQTMTDAGKAMFVGDPARYVELAALLGTAGLDDRELLAAVTAGFATFDPDQLTGVADLVTFDPTEELRDLLAGVASSGGSTESDRLAPVVPIESAKKSEPRHRAGDPAACATAGTGEATPSDDARDNEPADVVPMRPRIPAGVRRRFRDDRGDRRDAGDGSDVAVGWEGDGDGEDGEIELAPTGTEGDVPEQRRRPRRPSVAVARLAALAAAIPLIWAGLTSGVGVATAYGAGVAQPPKDSGHVAYLGVRLDDSQLTDPVIAQQLAKLHASAVLDEETAASDPAGVQHLVRMGIDVENGGAGPHFDSAGHRIDESPWTRADGDVAASHYLARIVGQKVELFIPGRRLNAFDLMACHSAHAKSVVPDRILDPTDDDPISSLTVRHTYLVSGVGATNQQMQTMLSELSTRLAASNLSGAPLADLV